ncbi:MAG: hypothetical protein A4E62_02842 [Syntrophorhabdus sp. PtaU1.Bin002]|nr:MAG: hypothetical protein A4E62_02842 [Syntrophorhabdus sp. PtaU1.Bin002]
MKTLIAAFISLLMLSACGSKDAEYYTNHPEELKAKMTECSKMSEAEKMADRECTAMSQANLKRALDMDPPKTNPLSGAGNTKRRAKF